MSVRLTESLVHSCHQCVDGVTAKLISTLNDETDSCTIVRIRLQSDTKADTDVDLEHYDSVVQKLKQEYPLLQVTRMRSLLDNRFELEIKIHETKTLWRLSHQRIKRGLIDRLLSSISFICIIAAMSVILQHPLTSLLRLYSSQHP